MKPVPFMSTLKTTIAELHAGCPDDPGVARALTQRSRPSAPRRSMNEALARDVLAGLRRAPKRICSSALYDAEGSRIFQRIMALPSYYLSRAEEEVFRTHAAAIAARFRGQRLSVVDLGAGDGSKTVLLLRALSEVAREVAYVPVDVSRSALEELERAHRERLPGMPFSAVEGDYLNGLAEAAARYPASRRLALFLGSNIGNLEAREAVALLSTWRGALSPGDELLLGFDLLKDPDLLQRAYDDDEGVTAEFNRNLLRRLNRELDADFDLDAFRHLARYNPQVAAMESYLVSARDQVVHVAGERIHFMAWEAMQTEISCKYREVDVRSFAEKSGFAPSGWYYDSRHWFLDTLFRVDGAPVA
jgi:dimethylhistidine N-methyltransferase